MTSQQPCASEGFDHFCFSSRIDIQVNDGVLNDAPGEGEPFLHVAERGKSSISRSGADQT